MYGSFRRGRFFFERTKKLLFFGLKDFNYVYFGFQAAVDAGGIIVQETVPVEVNDTEEDLIERVKIAEHKTYPIGLELLASGKVSLDVDGKVIWKTS